MNQPSNSKTFLKNVLRINALFSFSSGVLTTTFSGKLSEIMGWTSATIFYFMGPILCGFALYVWLQSNRQSDSHIKMIIFQDLLWVMSSVIVMFTNPFGITVVGLWLIAIVALIVLDFALLQMWGVRRMTKMRNY